MHDATYRLPLELGPGMGFDPRRPDLTLWCLEALHGLRGAQRLAPTRISWARLARVHDEAWLEALTHDEVVLGVFGLTAGRAPADALLETLRRVTGGTVDGALHVQRHGGHVLNLAGGFHHAFPDRGAGYCAVNDVAVAIRALRDEGFRGRIGVFDLDAHPPDGTAACLRAMNPPIFIGSISGSDWGPLPGVDETLLPEGAGNAPYLEALDALLARAPRCEMAFVLAGGDVLAGDPLGRLGLDLAGTWQRDLRVARFLERTPSVWVTAGGYRPDAWRVAVGTWWALRFDTAPEIPRGFDPLADHFRRVARSLPYASTGEPDDPNTLDFSDLEADLGLHRHRSARLLGYYTTAGLEVALHRYGLLEAVARLGYEDFRVELDDASPGERLRLYARAARTKEGAVTSEHLLVEVCVERQSREGLGAVLFVHWMTLRHPLGVFHPGRPCMPGQDVPGLGLAREATELLVRMAERLGLAGVVVRPAWFHVSWVGRARFFCLDGAAQGRFDALCRDLSAEPRLRRRGGSFALERASRAMAEGAVEVAVDGAPFVPWAWPAAEVCAPIRRSPPGDAWLVARDTARSAHRFRLRPDSPADVTPG